MVSAADARLREVFAMHFDPERGSPYWLRRAGTLGFDPRESIRSVDDLPSMGVMDMQALRCLPVTEFMPKCLAGQREWIPGETGGASGSPVATMYGESEFDDAFVRPFVLAAGTRDFPRNENWLFIGPTGPHLIGRAARLCARALGSPEPFTVDFDPRWVRRFQASSIGFKRYLDHVVEQSLRVLQTQAIGVLFATPSILERLQGEMPVVLRQKILGLHFGGQHLTKERIDGFQRSFPNAVLISGFGNTLFGMCPEFQGCLGNALNYYPLGFRILFGTVNDKDYCRYGEGAGRLCFSRLDKGFMILNCVERDQGEIVAPPADIAALGFALPGVHDPRPLPATTEGMRHAAGLY